MARQLRLEYPGALYQGDRWGRCLTLHRLLPRRPIHGSPATEIDGVVA